MTTDGLEVERNGVSENGNYEHANGGYKDHGWKKVTNLKKQRRQESKAKAGGAGQEVDGAAGKASDSTPFEALEHDAEERRAKREARIAAALAAGESQSGEEDSDAEGEHRGAQGNGVSNGEVKKPKMKKPKKPKVSVADAAAAIDASDLSAFLTDITESFASSPDVQLMRCADYFGRAFAAVSPAQFAWNRILRESAIAKAVEVPLCYVPDAVNKMMADWLMQRPADALSKFTMFLLKEILDDPQAHFGGSHKNSKSTAPPPQKAKVGVLVLLAIVLRRKPDVLQQQAASLRTQFHGQDKLPTLVWAYSQAAQGDLVVGMYLWVQNLLPLAVGKSSTPVSRDAALQFIESVLFANLKKARPILLNGVQRKGERLVPAASLDSVLRVAFPADSARTKATERFQSVYPILRELALAGSANNKATRPVAQQLFPLSLSAISEDVEALSLEACNNFIWCLSQNLDCYKQWETMHLENLKASTRVLGHIRHDWKDAVSRLAPLTNLKKTIQALRLKHKLALEMANGNTELEAQIKVADHICKAILSKLSSFPSCVKASITVAVGVSMAYGFYLLSPGVNPWNWDGWLLLSKTHSPF